MFLARFASAAVPLCPQPPRPVPPPCTPFQYCPEAMGMPEMPKKLIQFIISGGDTAPPYYGHSCAHLHALVKMGAVKQPGQIRNQGGVGRGIVDGGAHHQPIGLLKLGRRFVYHVVKDAFFLSARTGGTRCSRECQCPIC